MSTAKSNALKTPAHRGEKRREPRPDGSAELGKRVGRLGTGGGGSEAAALTGVPRAPGGMGRADIRSVRIPGAPFARGPGVVREGTA
ncbi:hypothetical protein Scani_05500 [Streptomyces caniferus]|uniref:Uncharacterized protein n=1 Tax=Streptomyces caniferus TaxID=285557 RepID=A0A640S0U8_9ACTN|nr:hypothetical protein Scani_05500 [Streptomyces caniferus]